MQEYAAVDVMSRIPFALGWYCWDLGEYRPFPVKYTTYWLFPYETLPPLPAQDPPFAFLAPGGDAPAPNPAYDRYREEMRQQLDTLASAAAHLGLTLPNTFVRFMSTPELHEHFRSGTGYWFTLSNRLVRCPGFDGAYLVCFLRDQQDCVLWCLCLTPDGQHCVLAVPDNVVMTLPEASIDALYGDLDAEEDIADIAYLQSGAVAPTSSATCDASSDVALAISDISICAGSFDEFIYRFWLEDEISWKSAGLDETPLTEVERQYVEHYERQRHGDG